MNMENRITFEVQDKRATLWSANKEDAPLIVLNNGDDDGFEIYTSLSRSGFEMSLLNIEMNEEVWNKDLSPWPCESLYKNTQDFMGDADSYLEILVRKILPKALMHLGGVPIFIGLAGYSLAGLFALYSTYRTTAFQKIACVSGSLWYPGFVAFAKENEFVRPEKIFLSLGNKEHKTRHPIVSQVAVCTEELTGFYKSRGIDTEYVQTEGNHFTDPVKRTIQGIEHLLSASATDKDKVFYRKTPDELI